MRKLRHTLLAAVFLSLTWNNVSAQTHFTVNANTVALWSFASKSGNTFPDLSSNGNSLTGANSFSLAASPVDSAVVFTGSQPVGSLTHANTTALNISGTGKLTYEARVYLTQYPPNSNVSQTAVLMGAYEGVRLEIPHDGSLQAGGQKLNGSSGYWWSVKTSPASVPLNRWVDLAVAFDQTTGQAYAYIDEVPVQTYGASTATSANLFRTALSTFNVGTSPTDNQPFAGMMDEARVSNNLVLGAGLPIITGTPSAIPTNLAYSKNPAVYATGVAIANNVPSVGGTVTSYSVNPPFPTGLSLNTTTGVISGTPTNPTPAADYVVTATNGAGSTTATVNISVQGASVAPTGLAYSSNTAVYTLGIPMTANVPSVTGLVTSFTISPSLPTGLSLNATSGVISGIPTAISSAKYYTITAFNGTASSSVTINITVGTVLDVRPQPGSESFQLRLAGMQVLTLPGSSRPEALEILDGQGRVVWTAQLERSETEIFWNGKSVEGKFVSSGVYFARMIFAKSAGQVREITRQFVYAP